MKLIAASYEIVTPIDAFSMLRHIELCGRVCYKSENRITADSAASFVRMLIDSHHESVIEHVSITVRFVVDRGVSHELVRHRIASFSQESTRYCNYSKGKFGGELTFIDARRHMHSDAQRLWGEALRSIEQQYLRMIELGVQPQMARSILPNSLKTEIMLTANLREWRTILRQRTAPAAHPQMREVMIPLLEEFRDKIPVVFDDL
ncbi:MAG: FAD-dependent thymidylate synthase [Ignavibacteriae bacterium]|nr:FAD-dependent thymidylate synthase [Ignavibacteriota bacterium]